MSSALAPVHVVVLAAGCGSRLGELGGETPKWLREVGGRTRADRQLEGILGAGEAVASINVVAGHAAHAIEDALADGAEVTGVTVHLVDEGVDTGPILAQREVEVEPRETLRDRIHAAEHALLPRVVSTLCAR